MAIIDLDEIEEIRQKSPFAHLKIQDDVELYKKTERYTCSALLGMDRSQVPFVKLPAPIDIIKHEYELDGKTTALHARVIAPEDVNIYNWKEMPQYEQPERILMLFPGPDAKKLSEIPRKCFDRLIVIDGTWKQAKIMVRDTPLLSKVQKVTIEPRLTFFWRYQNLSVNYLSTIEAIYYLYVEYTQAYEEKGYNGQYDNLLFYYKHLYDLIQYSYRKGEHKDRRFCWRHKANYIKDE
ncbi:hypothetical protein G6F57_004269 [Rhizopus arrhizus]|uniref:tRNA-uridine aminocarboxypropyltransferase 1 n=1 Tax=Rhizopus oryzae TaxID=64495 RepID=A0A9P6XD51_RHIOR|nr:hypothetical protein G6F23_007255 [Rhizopus arrhizus]KAG1412640.1 hypothetical protein G6F58_007910 [Rhizopus delemar]KAG0765957.1 hypothetical protein G6F24_003998 [Rhizopus arrhizus]KAG0777244.1 hypothetical protein G6F22_012007 [Rhizopus arrhizus]KAG0792784.1 hypothetical protein G6F21_004100 [Rhizopus arrhizus]